MHFWVWWRTWRVPFSERGLEYGRSVSTFPERIVRFGVRLSVLGHNPRPLIMSGTGRWNCQSHNASELIARLINQTGRAVYLDGRAGPRLPGFPWAYRRGGAR